MEYPTKIKLEGLSIGEHKIQFLLDDAFFSELEYSEISKGSIDVDLTLEKTSRLYNLVFKYKGEIEAVCDRCGDDFDFEVMFFSETVVRYGDEAFEDEGLIILTKQTTELDLKHYLYETLIVNLPSKIVHPKVNGKFACNSESIEKLEALSKKKENNDPRWDILKKLKK